MSKRQDRTNLRTDPVQIAGLVFLEFWKPVVGFDGYYVSNYGRVCSVDRVVKCDGPNRNTKEQFRRGRLLHPGASVSGHLSVVLGRGNTKHLHILVLEAFVGPRPDGCEGLHWDDNAANNHLTNLRWGTRSANLHDAVRNGKRDLGEEIKHSRLTDDAVRYIRANPQFSMNSLAGHFGVSCAAVKQVRDGVTWKHVT